MKNIVRLACGVLGAIALYACAEGATTPLVPDVRASAGRAHDRDWHGGDDGRANDAADGRLVKCEDQPSGTDSEAIGPSGGRLRVGANQLIIPPGALLHTVQITAIVPDDDVALIRFEPHGLVFRRSPLLVLDANGCDLEDGTPDVVYISGGQILERIEARYYPQHRVVAAPIEHFSGYALAW